MKKSINGIVFFLAFGVLLSSCSDAPPESTAALREPAVESGTNKDSADPFVSEEAPGHWIEIQAFPYRDGSVSVGFEELPYEGEPENILFAQGIFHSGPVTYTDYVLVFDRDGNLLQKHLLKIIDYNPESMHYNLHLSGDYLFYNSYINNYEINLTDGEMEYFAGNLYADNGALITSSQTEYGDRVGDLSGEIQVQVWTDGATTHTFLVPVEILSLDSDGVAEHPKYLPDDDLLIWCDPAHKYSIALSTGEISWEYNFPNPPEEIMARSPDGRYLISRVRYDQITVGSYFYCYDSQTEETYPLALSFGHQISVGDDYVALSNLTETTTYDLATGNALPVIMADHESGQVVGVAYHPESDRWIRACAPSMYAQEQETRRSATLLLEIYDGSGKVIEIVDTPFHYYYGKMEAKDVHLEVYGGQAVLLERDPDNALNVLSIGFMDLDTVAFERMDGDFYCVSGEYFYTAQYHEKQDFGIHSVTVRQYRGKELIDVKETEITELYLESIASMYYDAEARELVGGGDLFRLAFEEDV